MGSKAVNVNVNELINLYNQGYSCNQIAKMYNCSERPIYTRLKDAGIKMRNPQENQLARFNKNPRYSPGRTMVNKVCPECNKTFPVRKSDSNRRKFCSISCSMRHRY
jgi:transposase-like protein